MKFAGVIHHDEFNKAVLKALEVELNKINSTLKWLEEYINKLHEEILTIKLKLENHIENEENFKLKIGKNQK